MYRIGKKEINELAKVIESGSLFKVNSGMQESMHVEEDLARLFDVKHPMIKLSGNAR